MKKLISLLVLFCSLSVAQGWNNTVTTSINEPNLEKMDLAANASGIHVLIKKTNGNIVYYYLNSSGVIDANKTYTMEADGDFPNIVASNNVVYALYKTSSNIKGKYSTNGGTSWSNLPNITTTSNLCNGVDAEYQDQQGVHIVWATRDNDPYFETYYHRLDPSNLQWTDFKNVTDHSSAQIGGRPSVSFSSGRVHVSFNTSYFDFSGAPGYAVTRDRLNGDWQIPQFVVSGSEESVKEKLLVRGSTLFLFYAKYVDGVPIRNDLVYRTRSVSGTTWSSPTTLATSIEESGKAFNVTKTSNDNLHVVVYPPYVDPSFGLAYRTYNGSSWSNAILIDNDPRLGTNLGFTSVSNDLFLTFMRGSDNYLRYKQYDAAPLAPGDFAGSIYYTGDNSHPKIQWTLNNEPDVREASQGYVIWRKVNQSSYSQIATVSGGTSGYIDYGINYAGSGPNVVSYKIKARDKNNNESGFTNEVSILWGDAWKIVGDRTLVTEFKLFDNYPNPFNPSTKISWQSPVSGWQTLKVYDVLGNEVATLVDEYREAGRYEVEFNAVETRRGVSLSSGIYFYRLTAGSFTEVRKMILSK
ncbi:T9SS type A sorting domain-containing protein [Ignavibacterium album]|uniref:T9SS type A sorting domain-containing protein n=1 Tax=Ignavibacterium album TaxID=591197 RepID=UPI0026EBA219|nr:T9SS type A sorting domain-containing protein [Ignavibacterium album]